MVVCLSRSEPPRRDQDTFLRWQPRAKYRQSLVPTVEVVRSLAKVLRRLARVERVLFHYNGHGVRATAKA